MSFKWAAWTNVFLSIFMAAVLSILFTIGQGNHISLAGYFTTFAWALVGSLIVAFGEPLPRMGNWWARQMGADPMDRSGVFFVLDSMIEVAFFLVSVNLILTFALTGIGTIGEMTWFDRWWGMNHQFYFTALVCYIVLCLLASAIATKITGEKKPTVIEGSCQGSGNRGLVSGLVALTHEQSSRTRGSFRLAFEGIPPFRLICRMCQGSMCQGYEP